MKQFAHTRRDTDKVRTRTQIPPSRRAVLNQDSFASPPLPHGHLAESGEILGCHKLGDGVHKYLAGRGQTAVKHPTMRGTAAHDNQQPAPALHSGERHPGHCGALTHVPTAPGPEPHATAAGRHASDGM